MQQRRLKQKDILFASLAWFQLALSLLLATAIIWGHISFRASIGQLISSLAASFGAVSMVAVRTAETVEARQDMLEETRKMLVVTRNLITELKGMAANEVKVAPQYAAGLKSTSSLWAR